MVAKVKPEKGDKVKVYVPWTDTHLEGTVQSVLSVQFTFVTEDMLTYFCPYDGNWEYL
jgi:hypothetical protein